MNAIDLIVLAVMLSAAIALPEHRAYLPDTPPCGVVLESAKAHPIYGTEVSCRQTCLHVLNAAASATPPQPLACASGVSDGIELMRQADRRATGYLSFWYTSI